MKISCGSITKIKKKGKYDCRFELNEKIFFVGEFDNRIDAEIALGIVKAEWLTLMFEDEPYFNNLLKVIKNIDLFRHYNEETKRW